jgi:hypothetical protein
VAAAGVPTDANRLSHFAAAARADSKLAGRNRAIVDVQSHTSDTRGARPQVSIVGGE